MSTYKYDTFRFPFGKRVTVADAELALSRLSWEKNPKDAIVLDLSICEHFDVGVGWLLGNAIRRYATCPALKVIVPEPNDFSGRWFQEFTRSGLAFNLAAHATDIVTTNENITNKVKDYYLHGKSKCLTNSPISDYLWTGNNFCLVSNLHQGILDPNKDARFFEFFRELCSCISLDADLYEEIDDNELARFAYEAVQNIYDHANKSPLPSGTNILSYLSIKHYAEIKIKSWNAPLDKYLKEIKNNLSKKYEYKGWIEIVVNDDGIGIASRMSQDPEIYWADDDKEQSALIDALKTGSSIKLKTQELVRGDPGFGFTKMEKALRSVQAFGLLRTGRRIVQFDYLNPRQGFEMFNEVMSYMPGTTLQVLFPKRVSRK